MWWESGSRAHTEGPETSKAVAVIRGGGAQRADGAGVWRSLRGFYLREGLLQRAGRGLEGLQFFRPELDFDVRERAGAADEAVSAARYRPALSPK